MRKRWPKWRIIVLTAILTLLSGAIALNFIGNEKKIHKRVDHLYGVDDPQFQRSLSALLGRPIVAGNEVLILRNGDEIFAAMLAAIVSAQRTINFETYIYWSGDIGRRFADALAERARAGVRVQVLLDWLGSQKMEPELLKNMADAGVAVERYHPPSWYHLSRMNNRTHRKLLIVDGAIGFTGGVGIADQWEGNAQDPDHWRDTHFRLTGPAVAQMQSIFLDNWIKVSGEVQHGDDSFPELTEQGESRAQMFASSPSGGGESMQMIYLMAIAAARRNIYIAAAYFVPDDLTVETLVAARARGVDIQIVLPGEYMDNGIVRRASRARWGPLLEAGARIFEYRPTMYHCKAMMVDGLLLSVGSTNFDNRSFRLNDEANLNVFDPIIATQQEAHFMEDRSKSREITLAEWRNRPFLEKAREHAAALFRSQL